MLKNERMGILQRDMTNLKGFPMAKAGTIWATK